MHKAEFSLTALDDSVPRSVDFRLCMVRRATARGKFGREDKSAQMYSAFVWRSFLLAMMSCARIHPYKPIGR